MSQTPDVWDITQRALVDAGIDTYPPATKKGDCTTPYAVLKLSGAARIAGLSTQRNLYTVLCYVPRTQYHELSSFVARVKGVMAEEPIFPMLMPTGTETPPFFDDTYNAHMVSIEYRNNVRNTHL